tara:strand:- start:910 stop:1047 length:138 start_codon:yes stop_codon:yes gene_type:complete
VLSGKRSTVECLFNLEYKVTKMKIKRKNIKKANVITILFKGLIIG